MKARPLLQFTRYLWREMPREFAAGAALSLVVTAAEAGTVLLLAQILVLAGIQPGSGPGGTLSGAVTRILSLVGVAPTLGVVLMLFVAVTAIQALIRRAESLVAHRMELETGFQFRTRLYAAVAGARWLPLARLRGADLLTGLTSESDRVGAAAGYALSLLVHGLLALVYLAFALRVSTPVTAVAATSGAVLLVALTGARRSARAAGAGLSEESASLVASATEHLGALKVVKSYGMEARNTHLFTQAARRTVEMHERGWRAITDAGATFSVGAVAVLAVVTYVAMAVLKVSGGTVLLLVFLFYRLLPRLTHVMGLQQMLARDLPAWEGLDARIRSLEAEQEELAPSHGRVDVDRAVRFEGVSFSYEAARGDAVADLDLEIEARRTTAVVGPSGSGKTTVADLLMGLVTPRQGRVTVDGRPLDESWLLGWREGIGYVAQETVLFNGTVLDNLRWARPEASEEEVWEALRLAAADGFVSTLPDTLHTVVGDRGVRLSGGERQRLALARALLRRPALLILDEATSALDAENERRIRDAIRGLHGRMTILMITHRLPSVRDADVIHVIESGRWVESGSFDALMERSGGRFRRLWASQAGDDPLAASVEAG